MRFNRQSFGLFGAPYGTLDSVKFSGGEVLSLETTTALVKRLRVVTSKRAGVALGIWGEAGVGKTFTTTILQTQIPCPSARFQASVTNLALIHELPQPTTLPGWAKKLLERLEQGAHVDAKAFSTALSAWLAALAPFILHIEDLHEANPNNLSLWTNLAVEVKRTRGVALLVTSRSSPPEVFESYLLETLSLEAAIDLLESEAGAALPKEATAWIAVRARGNPLFSLEYFRHLTRLGYLWSDGRRWRWRVPEADLMPNSVEAVIGHHLRAASTSKAARTALAVKALLPLNADDDLWAKVAQLEPEALQSIKTELQRGGILRTGRFAHPLYRDATKSEIAPAQRHEIARRAIALLHEDDPVSAAAFEIDANLEHVEARGLLERAVSTLVTAGDFGQAAQFQWRMAALSPLTSRVDTMLEAAKLARQANLGQALEMANATLELDQNHIEATLLTAELLAEAGRSNEAEHLIEVSSRNKNIDQTRLLETQVRVKHLSHDYAGVLELWRSLDSSNIPLAIIARAFVQLSKLTEAQEVIAQALAAPKLERLELAELLYIQSFIPNFAGLYDAADVGFSSFLHILEVLSDGSPRFREMRSGALQLRAYTRNVLGRPLEAVADIQQALHFPEEFGDASHHAQLQSELGLYLLECGEYQKAEEVLFEARAVLERTGNPIYLSMLERIAARLYLEWAPPHGAALALKHAQAALETIERAGKLPSYASGAFFVAAWAHAIHGNPKEALDLVSELERLSIGPRQPGITASAAWVRALVFARLGQHGDAREAFKVVIASPMPLALGPTLERMALELDRLNNDPITARTRVERARAFGALSLVKIATRYFPELEIQTPKVIRSQTQSTVRLEVLGKTRVLVNGELLSDRTRKGKTLLSMLLQARLAGRRELSDLELIDLLYPEMPDDKGAGALKQLVYRLRSQLGSNAILRVGNGYTLGAVTSDAEEFLQTGNSQLWTGSHLEDVHGTWGSTAHDALQYALRKKAFALLDHDPAETARLGQILLEINPYDLEALDLSLRAFHLYGEDSGALQLSNWARAQFAEIGEVLPPELELLQTRTKPAV